MSENKFDAIVVGAGVAGSAAGYLLAKARVRGTYYRTREFCWG